MAELLNVHQTIARLVKTYPSRPSIGTTIPTKLVITNGSKQYPSTDAERGNVNVLDRCEAEEGFEWSLIAEEGEASSGGDIKERMRWREMEPRIARP